MFAAIAEIIAGPERAAGIAADHERYSRVAEAHAGLICKHVMRSDEEAQRFVDIMMWRNQDDSEAFGVDPDFQRIRPSRGGPYTPVVPERSWMNPGYYQLIGGFGAHRTHLTRQLVGFFHAAHGREQEFKEATQHLAARLSQARPGSAMWTFVSLGLPEWWCLVIQDDTVDGALIDPELLTLCSITPRIDTGSLVMRFDREGGAQ